MEVVETVVWIIAGLVLIQLALLVNLLVKKSSKINMELTIQRHLIRLEADYWAFLFYDKQDEPELPSNPSERVQVIERILNKVVDEVKGDVETTRVQEAAHKYLSNPYKKYLHQGSWSQRVNTLYYLEDFQMADLKEEVYHHFLRLENIDEEYRQTLRVLASFRDERMIRVLLNQNDLPQRLVKQMLYRFPKDFIYQMIQIINDEAGRVPYNVHIGLITFCGEKGDSDYLDFVETRLHFPSKELRLKALKSLTEMCACSDLSLLEKYYHSPLWEERMYAAKLAGILKISQAKDILLTLAGDGEWWVRYAACEALRRLPDGQEILSATADQHEDRFARDMAQQLLTVKVGESV
ncbi:HEAT repeat domain-containing protein [Halobacillus litoralis]|uniref:HEAT repeat domain-containing protein n=1 Tax=Halobacillus litoralis TaxID=45668 RepID=UPI001CFE6248|nr:HEAT repeat domain-containing protein [Halobacillus litoralis]